MLNLTQTLALELAPRGIRVNAVSPGPVATEAFLEVLGVSDQLDELQATIPLGRLGTPDDIAAAVVFMASPAAELGDRSEPARRRRTDRAQLPLPTTSRLKRTSVMDFEGKVLFATGGGSGIAAATARRFAAGGGRVAVVDLDAGQGAGGRRRHRRGAIGLGADVADEASVVAAVEATREQLGRIDCVLNAAGHAAFGPIEEWTLERWHRMMAVHAGGTFLVCKHVLPIMREQGGGSIVNIASTAALTANKNNSPYGAAKGAIVSFSRQLAREAAPDVRVNTRGARAGCAPA